MAATPCRASPDHQRRLGDGWEGRVEEGGAISGGARFGHVDRAGAIPVEHCRHRARLTPLIEIDGLFGRHFRGIGMRCEAGVEKCRQPDLRSEEHTSELQSLMRISYAVFCL